ncbi:uncharacterized protein BXZ73DRAFT_55508 [Epithele typhae]|uniref:uncharacterized protein n=1 Tax=Epithele typhae TaxID=378194 RepID=UPI0020075AE6|nr:uncharacterized protein BXZ73DRAFT_55508 [Epithele typhae]KAH9913479.1 hypothetical protein BXZ73DRAFT_55508 [Epithele typhae]
MHLISLNIPDLVISLFRGSVKCYRPDDKATWDFAVLKDDEVWAAHGQLVADATRYLPGSFDRPPRNPAEKLNSGFKAWEFLLYVYGLLPGLLRLNFKPELHHYYRHFCKLVYGARRAMQHTLPLAHIAPAFQRIHEYVHEFEPLYYQGLPERLHFIRPCLHTLYHVFQEIERTGPCSVYTQYTLENFIGNLTREIKQHVTPYANVAECGFRRCQAISLKATYPELDPDPKVPEDACKPDDAPGFILLRPKDSAPRRMSPAEVLALSAYLESIFEPVPPTWDPIVMRWARLCLPNHQIARTLWKEGPLEAGGYRPRRARMLNSSTYAEVQYFFLLTVLGPPKRTISLAMLSVFSAPDQGIYQESLGTVLACTYRGQDACVVRPIKTIDAVVAMVPLPPTSEEQATGTDFTHRYFVVEKPGLEVAVLAGRVPDLDGDEDDI